MRITARHLCRYTTAMFLPLEHCLIEKNSNDALLILVFSILFPPLLFIIPIYLLTSTHKKIIEEHTTESPERMKKIILCIQMNHLQQLKECFDDDPQLLNKEYKKKSLLFWCKHYRNTNAHFLIINETKKRMKQKNQLVKT